MQNNRCSQCGREFAEDELIRFGDSTICAQCKPFFIQGLKEGINVTGEMVYAGFWIRFGAKLIDGIALNVAGFILGLAGGFIGGFRGTIVANFLSVFVSLAYEIIFLGKFGATPGKMLCGLKVVRSQGESISYALACGRFFAQILSGIIFGIGYIMAGFDVEKRALHDRICDTRVIRN